MNEKEFAELGIAATLEDNGTVLYLGRSDGNSELVELHPKSNVQKVFESWAFSQDYTFTEYVFTDAMIEGKL